MRTQQVLAFESGMTRHVDPLAGSWYVEELTDRKLTETSDLAILWLALSAYAILGTDESRSLRRP